MADKNLSAYNQLNNLSILVDKNIFISNDIKGTGSHLGGEIAEAMVKGYQGSDLKNETSLMACIKHFALYGAAEAGRDYNTVDMSRQTMYQYYLPPYKAAVDAGTGSIMTSFNDGEGIPTTANKWLINDVLKKQWGFKGFVVTDFDSIQELTTHGVSSKEFELHHIYLWRYKVKRLPFGG